MALLDNMHSSFPLFKLPIELRRLIYEFCDLKAPYVLRSHHILDYVNGHEPQFAPLLNIPEVKVEAFTAVMQQNIIDLTELLYVFPVMETYIKTVQADMSLWLNIRTARIDWKAAFDVDSGQFSAQGIDAIERLGLCKRLLVLQVYFPTPCLDLGETDVIVNSGVVDAALKLCFLTDIHLCWNCPRLTCANAMSMYAAHLDRLDDLMLHLKGLIEEQNSVVEVHLSFDFDNLTAEVMDTTDKTLISQDAKRTEIDGGDRALPQVQHYQFEFWSLPLELRLIIYSYCHLTADFTIDTNVLIKYIKGRRTGICALVDASRILRAEAFKWVLQQNLINIIGLKQNLDLFEYISKTQIPEFSLWNNIQRVRLNVKTDNTLIAAAKLLPMCAGLRVLELVLSPKNSWKEISLRSKLHQPELASVLEQMHLLRKIVIIVRRVQTTYMLHTLLSERVRRPAGSLYKFRYKWERGQGPTV